MKAKLGTKAETLSRLYGQLEYAKVLPQFTFTVAEWDKNKEAIIHAFDVIEWKKSVIVRSSSLCEDTEVSSQAGKYESITDVSGSVEFEQAVNRVVASYDDMNPQNQVLVQPMLEKV